MIPAVSTQNRLRVARSERAFVRLRNLSYLTLWTVNFDQEKNLYKEILGLPVGHENASFIMYETKGSRLAFHRLKKGSRLDRQTVELHFEVDDVDEVYTALQRKGVKFADKPANRPWGNRMASFHDAEGYVVEIVGPLKPGEPVKGD
jgi:catechol 2,3-dioxygenase-like lactoylglutathione lyase family enzyme